MTEITILALYGLLVILTLILQATGTMTQLGMGYLLSSRDEERSVSGIAARLDRALNNSVTAMVLFAPAVLLLVVTDSTSNASLLAAQVFLIARLVYLPAYALRITGVRSLAWTVGIVATIALYLLAL
ncbi:MAPEG family protein [Roseobacter sp. YSTF-M11]|uniref:MAPEG family protein n=1 Tax=Roseobacter insulae TaxID=2859783 RepID=A0A9X1K1Y3_9RHOB|nr:MAPEG family protein [Roseobacter insulae]MBW4709694.1 MAPEG family protein [Roseobacter insulae]